MSCLVREVVIGDGVRSFSRHAASPDASLSVLADTIGTSHHLERTRTTLSTRSHAEMIWRIAGLLCGPYRPMEYGQVMLPFTVLPRTDCVLKPTKSQVPAAYDKYVDNGVPLMATRQRPRRTVALASESETRDGKPMTATEVVIEELVVRLRHRVKAFGEVSTPQHMDRMLDLMREDLEADGETAASRCVEQEAVTHTWR